VRLWLAAVAALLLPLSVRAQDLPALYPALYDVTGVAAGDVLNIRAEGRADAAAVGSLAPDARGVEVVRESGGWGLVSSGEGSGWVSMRYLVPQDGPPWYALQSPVRCIGTEPFWSLGLAGETGAAVYSTPEGGDSFITVSARWPGSAATQSAAVALPEGFAVITGGECSDGMSDRAFGLRAELFLTGDAPQRQSGCCTIAP
jgi:uncharacterized membrane protein